MLIKQKNKINKVKDTYKIKNKIKYILGDVSMRLYQRFVLKLK